jgi:hypothetical protein
MGRKKGLEATERVCGVEEMVIMRSGLNAIDRSMYIWEDYE